MKIIKSASSEIFDIYASGMIKRASKLSSGIELLVGLFKVSDNIDDIAAAMLKLKPQERAADLAVLKASNPEIYIKLVAKLLIKLTGDSKEIAIESLQLAKEVYDYTKIINDPGLAAKYLKGVDKVAHLEKSRNWFRARTNTLTIEKEGLKAEAEALRASGQDLSKVAKSIEDIENYLRYADEGIRVLVTKIDDVAEGVTDVARGVTGVAEGVAEVTEGMGRLETKMANMESAINSLPEGIGRAEIQAEFLLFSREIKKVSDKVIKGAAEGAEQAKKSKKAFKDLNAKLDEGLKKVLEVKSPKDGKGFMDWLITAKKGTLAYSMAYTGVAAVKGGFKLLGLGAIAGLVWFNWPLGMGSDPTAKAIIKDTSDKLSVALASLEAINPNFGDPSKGRELNESLIQKLKLSIADMPMLLNPENTPEKEAKEILTRLDDVSNSSKHYLSIQTTIGADLADKSGWPQAIAALEDLPPSINSLAGVFTKLTRPPRTGEEGETTKKPAGKKRREIIGALAAISYIGEDLAWAPAGFSRRNPNFINAIDRWAETWLLRPKGRAILMAAKEAAVEENKNKELLKQDPNATVTVSQTPLVQAGKFTGNIVLDTLIKIYKSVGPNVKQRDLKKLVSPGARGRRGGWRQEKRQQRGRTTRRQRKETRKNLRRQERKAELNFFTQKFNKTANLSSLDDNFVKEDSNFIKMSDSFSKSYYQDAISGLADQYAKSYYTGLKGMYSEKLSKTEADYGKLYNNHDETGAELVGRAHPKSIVTSESMGRGGLVENLVEQKRHMEGVALSMPSGNYRQKHAWVIKSLVKLANKADDNSLLEASDLIDAALKKIVSLSKE